MKTTNKILSFALACIVAALSAPAFAGEVLDNVMQKGVLTIANDANWAPQSFLNDDNEMDGFDVDVAKEIAKRLGVKAEFVNPEWGVITAGNWAGRWDISIGSMTPTKDRAKILEFPAVYYYTPAAVAVHQDSKAQKASDLSGKKIGVGAGTTFEQYVAHDLDMFNAPPFTYEIDDATTYSLENTGVLLDDLRLGDGVRMDGMVGNLPSMLEAIKRGYPVKILYPPVFYEPLAIAVEHGDKQFSDKLAAAVSDMHTDGTLSRLSKKWYGVDYTATVAK